MKIVDKFIKEYKSYKNYHLYFKRDGINVMFFKDLYQSNEELIINKLVNKDNHNIFVSYCIGLQEIENNLVNIQMLIDINLYNGEDTIYIDDLAFEIKNADWPKSKNIFKKIESIKQIIFNIKIDINRIIKIFEQSCQMYINKKEIESGIIELKKHKYLDKNNINDILNIISRYKNCDFYVQYRKAIFETINLREAIINVDSQGSPLTLSISEKLK
jgi:hypothetical protein